MTRRPLEYTLFPYTTLFRSRENLRMATYAGVDMDRVEERAYAQFPRLGERRGQLAGTLSGGEQQMLALARRSEEHTSELQSQSNLVCRLLLEKKKNESRLKS